MLSVENTPSLLTLVFSAVVLYILTLSLYTLYLHPLSNHPGPLLNALSPLPRLYLNINGHEPQKVLKLHLKYGPILRLAPDELSFTLPSAWKDIYGTKTRSGKDWTMYALSENTKRSIILASEETHARQRKMLAPAFGERALRSQQGMLTRYTGMMNEWMREAVQENRTVDLAKVFNCVTFDTIADLMFGEPLGLCQDMKYSPWLKQVFGSIWLAGSSRALQYFPLLFALITKLIPKSVQDAVDASFGHTVDRVDKRLAMKTERPDMLGLMLKHKEDGADMSMDELYANADLLMIAGTETTATSLAGLMWNLLANPECLRRLSAEIRGAFKSVDEITMETLPRLPYLSACLEEGMRCFPAVPEGIRRVTPPEGANICGHWIPGNVKVSIPHYAAYHSPANFVDCDEFIPERWLAPGSEGYDARFEADRKEVLQPFSVGPRNCIGLTLAYHEMRLVIANLLWNFDIKLAEEADKNWLDQTVHLVWDKKPLLVKIVPRGEGKA